MRVKINTYFVSHRRDISKWAFIMNIPVANPTISDLIRRFGFFESPWDAIVK